MRLVAQYGGGQGQGSGYGHVLTDRHVSASGTNPNVRRICRPGTELVASNVLATVNVLPHGRVDDGPDFSRQAQWTAN